MFIKIIFSYLLGYLEISVEGYYIERFINICKNQNIMIWNLKKKEDININFNLQLKEFRKVCKIAKKTKCKLKIINRKGIPFLIYKYKKRKGFLFFLMLLIILITICSQFIWNIDTVEVQGKTIDNVLEDIETAGLQIGKLKSKINTKEVIHKIRLKRNDIAWIGIELKGTNAIVKLAKADQKPDIIDEKDYCNIISNEAGVITKINAQTGMANVKVGDTIQKGDILINGWMEGKFTGVRYVHAKGEIEAKVWHTKNKKIPYHITQKELTGNEESRYSLKINNFKINFNKKLSKFKFYDTIETEKKIKLFSDFYLPISIIKTTYKEQEQIEKDYSKEEAKALGIEELEKELEKEIEEKNKIVNKNINVYEQEDGINVYVTYEVLENIGTNEKIVF